MITRIAPGDPDYAQALREISASRHAHRTVFRCEKCGGREAYNTFEAMTPQHIQRVLRDPHNFPPTDPPCGGSMRRVVLS